MGAVFWDVSNAGYEQLVSTFDRSPWDQLYLGGMLLPGLAMLEDGHCSRKIDIKNAKGADGATITHNGYEPAKFTFKLTIADPIDWAMFQQVLPLIQPKLGKPPSVPLRCEYPGLAAYGIDRVIVEKVSLPKKGNVSGTREIAIHLVQWVPQPKKAKAMKKGAGIDVPPTAAEVARDKYAATGARNTPEEDAAWAVLHPGEAGPAPLVVPPSAYSAIPNPK
jgi:hypothetical protein